jgi:hypothetical protein
VGEYFMFRKPFARVEQLTMVWYTPYEQYTPPTDLLTMTMTFANPTSLASTTAHGLVTGDLVYIENSDSGDTDVDALLTRRAGYIITVTSPTAFTIPVNTAAIAGTQVVQVYLAAKRLSLQFEFLCLQQ